MAGLFSSSTYERSTQWSKNRKEKDKSRKFSLTPSFSFCFFYDVVVFYLFYLFIIYIFSFYDDKEVMGKMVKMMLVVVVAVWWLWNIIISHWLFIYVIINIPFSWSGGIWIFPLRPHIYNTKAKRWRWREMWKWDEKKQHRNIFFPPKEEKRQKSKRGDFEGNFLLNGGEWKDDTKLKKIKSNKWKRHHDKDTHHTFFMLQRISATLLYAAFLIFCSHHHPTNILHSTTTKHLIKVTKYILIIEKDENNNSKEWKN